MKIRFEGHSDDLVQVYDWVPNGERVGRHDVFGDGGVWRFVDEFGCCWDWPVVVTLMGDDDKPAARVGLLFDHRGWVPLLKPLRDVDHCLFPAGMVAEFPDVPDGRHFAMVVTAHGVTRGDVEVGR